MDQNSAETTSAPLGDTKAVETWLKALWDRARKAAELIAHLREEKAALQQRVASLEEELSRTKESLLRAESTMKDLAQRNEATESGQFLNGEREELSARVKALLAKLDEYL